MRIEEVINGMPNAGTAAGQTATKSSPTDQSQKIHGIRFPEVPAMPQEKPPRGKGITAEEFARSIKPNKSVV